MSCDPRPRCVSIAALFGVAILVGCTGASPSGDPGSTARAAEPASAEEDSAANGQTEAEDGGAEFDLTVPEGDAAKVLAYLKRLDNYLSEGDVPGESQDEKLAYLEKAMRVMVDAADRVLAAKPTLKQEAGAVEYRLRALQGLNQVGSPDDAKEFTAAVDAVMADKRGAIAKIGWEIFLTDRISTWSELDLQSRWDLEVRLVRQLEDGEVTPLDVRFVVFAAQNLDRTDDEFLTRLLEKSIPLIEQSKSPEAIAMLEEANLAGMLRRFTLLGKQLKVTGELLSGGEVDWESYRGKVVLVDFWATWCGPCRAEVPNILKMYKAYHDKGFEVLGVSLDDKAEAAKKYKADMKLPWDSLFPANEDERSWNNPLARYYGITGIPTAFLLDQQGNVVHMDARGPMLREQLQKLLGEPADEADEPAAAPRKAS